MAKTGQLACSAVLSRGEVVHLISGWLIDASTEVDTVGNRTAVIRLARSRDNHVVYDGSGLA